jgi:hypothetical protein
MGGKAKEASNLDTSNSLSPRNLNSPGTLIDRCITYRWDQKFSTYVRTAKTYLPQTPGFLLCYTDSSGNPDGLGSGCAAYEGTYEDPVHKASEFTGVTTKMFQSDLYAIEGLVSLPCSRFPHQSGYLAIVNLPSGQ